MADVSKNDQEILSKKKKRPRLNSVIKNKDIVSSQYEENFTECFIKKLSNRLNENSFHEMLLLLEEFENNNHDVKKLHERIELLLKDQDDLLQEFLCFLKPYEAFECGNLMLFYEMYNVKQFVINLMLYLKRQPHVLNQIMDKLCFLAEHENVLQTSVEESIIPFLQKNSALVQQFLQLLPEGKPPDWCFSSDESWEDFNIDSEIREEETFDIPSRYNDVSIKESKNCVYNCKQNKSQLCPVCSVKFINGRMYVANGKILRPAQIIFDPSEQTEQIRRLSGNNNYFVPTSSKPRSSKKVDLTSKDSHEERLSPVILGTESEEEIGENEPHRKKRRKKIAQRLKIRFDTEKKETENTANQTDDTAPSNDEVSCDETCKEDKELKSCDDISSLNQSLDNNMTSIRVSHISNKEIVKLGDMELNFSESSIPWSIKTHSTETNG